MLTDNVVTTNTCYTTSFVLQESVLQSDLVKGSRISTHFKVVIPILFSNFYNTCNKILCSEFCLGKKHNYRSHSWFNNNIFSSPQVRALFGYEKNSFPKLAHDESYFCVGTDIYNDTLKVVVPLIQSGPDVYCNFTDGYNIATSESGSSKTIISTKIKKLMWSRTHIGQLQLCQCNSHCAGVNIATYGCIIQKCKW